LVVPVVVAQTIINQVPLEQLIKVTPAVLEPFTQAITLPLVVAVVVLALSAETVAGETLAVLVVTVSLLP
jgi:hypothetical protein